MKLLCKSCKQYMGYSKHDTTSDGSLDIGFACPKCGMEVSLITNPGETQAAADIGLKLGGQKVEADPNDAASSKPNQQKQTKEDIHWEPEAEARLERVPVFVRPMAKRSIENFAREKGINIINLAVMNEAREVIGH